MLTLFEGQRSRMVARYFRSYALVKNTLYWLGSDLGEGFGAGFAFFAGLDTPKLMSKKPNPLRSVSSRLMVGFLSEGYLPGLVAFHRGTDRRGRWSCGRLAAQDFHGFRGQRLVGVGQQQAYLPHFGIGEYALEARHAGEADAIGYLPIGFAGRVVADADYVVVVVLFPQRGRMGIHVGAKGGRLAVHTVATGALVAVDLGACHQVVLIDLDGGSLDQFAVDTLVQRNPGEQPLLGQRMVCNGHWHVAKSKPCQHGDGYKNHPEKNSKQNPGHIVDGLRWFSS